MQKPFSGRILLITIGCSYLASLGYSAGSSRNKIEGVWKLVSYDYGNGNAGTSSKSGEEELKFISSKHYVWVHYDIKKKATTATGGGTYTLSGDSFIEHVDFMDADNKALTEKYQSFTVKIDGDTLVQSGTLSVGIKIRETWKRVE